MRKPASALVKPQGSCWQQNLAESVYNLCKIACRIYPRTRSSECHILKNVERCAGGLEQLCKSWLNDPSFYSHLHNVDFREKYLKFAVCSAIDVIAGATQSFKYNL